MPVLWCTSVMLTQEEDCWAIGSACVQGADTVREVSEALYLFIFLPAVCLSSGYFTSLLTVDTVCLFNIIYLGACVEPHGSFSLHFPDEQ